MVPLSLVISMTIHNVGNKIIIAKIINNLINNNIDKLALSPQQQLPVPHRLLFCSDYITRLYTPIINAKIAAGYIYLLTAYPFTVLKLPNRLFGFQNTPTRL